MKNNPLCIILCLLLVGFTACNSNTEENQDSVIALTGGPEYVVDSAILIPAEAVSSDYFPCNDCHSELVPNPQRRQLIDMHDDIVFDHDSENRSCLACHNTFDRDSLILAGGRLLGFNESYKLCGQCHGPKYRDWKLGIHGKRTGEWNGNKQYLLCVHCHDPHSPRFKDMQPLTTPRGPEHIYIDSIYEKQEKNPTSP
jgi:uncharacterized CHY-type Zn-finger protein